MTQQGLTRQQIDDFNREGCIAIPGELSPEKISALMSEAKTLLKDFSLKDHPMTKFTTGENEEDHVGDAYFLESSDKVSFFFEPDAFDSNGELLKPKENAINKIGHALHELNKEYQSISNTERNVAIAKSLGFKDPRILQSMLICKQPEIGGEVPTHQDGVFLYTEPKSAVGFWYALEDCTKTNGALEYHPGSHLKAPIAKRLVRTLDADGKAIGTHFETIPGPTEMPDPPKEEFKVLECPAGSLVLIHNSVLHRSNSNTGNKSRYAYTFHVIEGENKYDGKNWLQVPVSGGTDFTKLNAGITA